MFLQSFLRWRGLQLSSFYATLSMQKPDQPRSFISELAQGYHYGIPVDFIPGNRDQRRTEEAALSTGER